MSSYKTDPQRQRALELAITAIKKQFGPGSIMKLGDSAAEKVEVISTRCLSIDIATGIGGIPRGRITEAYGWDGAGKSSLALHLVAEAQSKGLSAAYVDQEHCLDIDYAKALGVNTDEMFCSQPGSGEEGLEITEALVRSGACDLLIVDSVAALVPRAELEGEMGDSLPGLQARLLSQACRKLTAVVHESNTALVFINQLRNIIPMGGQMYGPKETTCGGRALRFYASLRMEIKRIAQIKKGEDVIGARTKVKIVKNKLAPPFKDCECDLIFGYGFNATNSIVDEALAHSVFTKLAKSNWYSYEGENFAQGRDGVAEKLREDKKLQFEIRDKILEAVAMQQAEKTAQKSNAVQ